MPLKILYFGDIFAKPGREAVRRAIHNLKKTHEFDFIIVNGENAAHGKGLTPQICEEFFSWEIDCITTGNHVWDQKEIIDYLPKENRVLRPANYPESQLFPAAPGKGWVDLTSRKNPSLRLRVLHLMGRLFMPELDCPFQWYLKNEAQMLSDQRIPLFVDFHGEASSEKQAFTAMVDGKAIAVVGSHTHVQTADERVSSQGTAAITDVGMCGCFDSVIGVRKELSIQRFVTRLPTKFEPANGPGGIGAVIIEVDSLPTPPRALSITRLRWEQVP